jgi:hypothetical protein
MRDRTRPLGEVHGRKDDGCTDDEIFLERNASAVPALV